ncbi:dual specificity protein phosphatase family protein [Allosalinactinospora lopnorensis]|uniref:dual specificity protein phosphatase family protein n=1 Tax=Allosalinactinospora lopnorensis TaxID=1352348 RepID=UPI000623EC6B|nr:dual specificity protein phosphatase family protein [Allosalinactinospora lopnorensis]
MPSESQAPTVSANLWDDDDPRHDRAAGAWLGAAAVACIVGASAPVVKEIARPDGGGTGPALLSWLVVTALRHLDDPGGVAAAVGAGPHRSWALALRSTLAEGRVPAAGEGTPESGPEAVSRWAVECTPVPPLDPARGVFPCAQLVDAVRSAHAASGEEAAMYAGALAGARWGLSGIPLRAQRRLADTIDPGSLVRRAVVTARGSAASVWPEQPHHHLKGSPCIRHPFGIEHPHDPGVTLGNLSYMRSASDIGAVVTLCRIGAQDPLTRLPGRDRIEVWLADTEGVNPNLHFVIDEAARAVAALRSEGKRVLLHCAAGQSRTPAVAAHYAVLSRGVDVVEALRTIIPAVGGHLDTPELSRATAALHGVELADPLRELFPGGPPQRRRAPRD